MNRLHRIFKNLGYHNDTLLWIVRALISILVRANHSKDTYVEVRQLLPSEARLLLSVLLIVMPLVSLQASVRQVTYMSQFMKIVTYYTHIILTSGLQFIKWETYYPHLYNELCSFVYITTM